MPSEPPQPAHLRNQRPRRLTFAWLYFGLALAAGLLVFGKMIPALEGLRGRNAPAMSGCHRAVVAAAEFTQRHFPQFTTAVAAATLVALLLNAFVPPLRWTIRLAAFLIAVVVIASAAEAYFSLLQALTRQATTGAL